MDPLAADSEKEEDQEPRPSDMRNQGLQEPSESLEVVEDTVLGPSGISGGTNDQW